MADGNRRRDRNLDLANITHDLPAAQTTKKRTSPGLAVLGSKRPSIATIALSLRGRSLCHNRYPKPSSYDYQNFFAEIVGGGSTRSKLTTHLMKDELVVFNQVIEIIDRVTVKLVAEGTFG